MTNVHPFYCKLVTLIFQWEKKQKNTWNLKESDGEIRRAHNGIQNLSFSLDVAGTNVVESSSAAWSPRKLWRAKPTRAGSPATLRIGKPELPHPFTHAFSALRCVFAFTHRPLNTFKRSILPAFLLRHFCLMETFLRTQKTGSFFAV